MWPCVQTHCALPSSAVLFGGHGEHAFGTSDAVNVSAAHFVHLSADAAPTAAEIDPSAHLVHVSARVAPAVTEYVPAPHATQLPELSAPVPV